MLVLRDLLHVWEEKGPPACAPAEQGCTATPSQPAHTAALLYLSPVFVAAMLAADCALCSASQTATQVPRQLFCCATWRQDLLVFWAKPSLRLLPSPEYTFAFLVLAPISLWLSEATRLAALSFCQAVGKQLFQEPDNMNHEHTWEEQYSC